jgi:integrase-like protein
LRPYHPQTCGKVERFHQTMKAFLERRPKLRSIGELQIQIGRFVAYYNDVRPHRATGRRPPRTTFDTRDEARPSGSKILIGQGMRVRHDRISKGATSRCATGRVCTTSGLGTPMTASA